MGLLTDDQATAIGLLGAGMMAGNTPMGFQQGILSLDQAKDNAIKRQLGLLQLQKAQQDFANEQRLADAARANMVTPEQARAASMGPMPDGSAVAPQQAGFNAQGFVNAAFGIDPIKGMQFQAALAKELPYGKVDPKDYTPESVRAFQMGGNRDYSLLQPRSKAEVSPGGIVFDPYNIKPGTVLPDPNKPFAFNPQGQLVPNSPYQQYELGKAKAGSTQIGINTEKSFLSNLGEGFGKGISDAKQQAQSSLGTINTVNRLQDALDSGKVMAGPGATFRQFGLQIGNTLGISGKDANESMLNTRQAIQSLAQLELDGAQQMKGQGQITEAERDIIRRAASGNIDSMTVPELRLLGGVLDKSARFKIRNYNQQVAPVKAMPNAAAIAPFLDVAEPAPRQAPNVLRFDKNGNLITN